MKQNCTYASDLEEMLHLVHALVYSIGRLADNILKQKGITYSECITLLTISAHASPITQHGIAESLGISGAAVSRTIQRMAEKEYVMRSSQGVVLTEKGEQIAKEAKDTLLSFLESKFTKLDEYDIRQTNNTLQHLISCISK